jgi:PTS system mannitol-specific IIC component
VFVNVAFNVGLRAPAAPGSILAVYAQTAPDSFLGVTISWIAAAAVTLVIGGILLRLGKDRDDDLVGATAEMEAMKGKKSAVGGLLTAPSGVIKTIVFACDAGMGSSAMGASVLRNKIKNAGIEGITVVNKAVANLDGTADLVITQSQLTDRAKQKAPEAIHVSVDNFMNSPKYDEVVEMVSAQAADKS